MGRPSKQGFGHESPAAAAEKRGEKLRPTTHSAPFQESTPSEQLGSQVARADLSLETRDQAWDSFLASTPGGHYMQASPWAELKSAYGWEVARVTATRDEQILGGAQVLLRPLPGKGKIGWAPRAPVLGSPEVELAELIVERLQTLASEQRIKVLMIQPPRPDEGLLHALTTRRFHATPVIVGPQATLVLDLERNAETLLSGMRKKTRQHIHRGLRAGVMVREGDEGDLELLYRFHLETARRKGFPPYPEGYLPKMWHAFRPGGAAQMFVAEHHDEPVAALLVLAFGQTVYTLATGWSGRHSEAMPNEVLYWSAIEWSRQRGYRCFDFTEVDVRAPDVRANGRPFPDDLRKSPTFFKLGFGGDIIVFPSAYAFVPNRLLAAAFRWVVPRLYRRRRIRLVLNALRWRSLRSARARSDE